MPETDQETTSQQSSQRQPSEKHQDKCANYVNEPEHCSSARSINDDDGSSEHNSIPEPEETAEAPMTVLKFIGWELSRSKEIVVQAHILRTTTSPFGWKVKSYLDEVFLWEDFKKLPRASEALQKAGVWWRKIELASRIASSWRAINGLFEEGQWKFFSCPCM